MLIREYDLNFLVSFLFSSVLLSTFSAECSALSGDKSKAGVKGIELKQTHYFLGNMTVLASKDGVRMESKGAWKFVLVAKAPDWKVTAFRDDDKVYYSCSLKEFEEIGLVSQYLIGKKPRAIIEGDDSPTSLVLHGVHTIRRSTPYFVSERLPVGKAAPAQMEAILYGTYRMPTNGGVPLKYTQVSGKDWMMSGIKQTGQKPQIMLTTSSAKETNVPPNSFSPPRGYALAKSFREVLISKASRDQGGYANEIINPPREPR